MSHRRENPDTDMPDDVPTPTAPPVALDQVVRARRKPRQPADALDVMCLLRDSGWLVVLKCVPDLAPWIAEMAQGQHDVISRRRWCCEAQWLGKEWRHSQVGFSEHPREAVMKVFQLIAEDEAKRPNESSSPTGGGK